MRVGVLLTSIGLVDVMATAQTIVPTHSTPPQERRMRIALVLFHGLGGNNYQFPPVDVLPMLDGGFSALPALGIHGRLMQANVSNVGSIQAGDIAYISCDPLEEPAGTPGSVLSLLHRAFDRGSVASIVYSTTTGACAFDRTGADAFPHSSVYTMTNPTDAMMVSHVADSLVGPHLGLIASAGYARSIYNGTRLPPSFANGDGVDPARPSSTAVAMIVLYSVTGIITALFLVIIVTGAIRAHRHPDRYGPQDTPGLPRQSRAKGIARAMLETIPIVRWGETPPTKPGDVELAHSPSPAPDDSVAPASSPDAAVTTPAETPEVPVAREAEDAATAPTPTKGATEETEATASAPAAPMEDDGAACSICTEEFEKGEAVRVLPCDHKYHPQCIDPWLLNVSGTCPLCRVDLRDPEAPSETPPNDDPFDPQHYRVSSDDAPPARPATATHRSSRRFSTIRDLLNRHHMQEATREERIATLRLVRQQSLAQMRPAGEGTTEPERAASDGHGAETEAATSEASGRAGRRRLTVLVAEALHRRSRREEDLGEGGGSSTDPAAPATAPATGTLEGEEQTASR